MADIRPIDPGRWLDGRDQPARPQLSRSTQRRISGIGERTLTRMARVQGEGLVQGEKMREVDHLARSAMTGHTMLRRWADCLAHDDPLLHDELNALVRLAEAAKAEILSDTIDTYCRESRS